MLNLYKYSYFFKNYLVTCVCQPVGTYAQVDWYVTGIQTAGFSQKHGAKWY